ncbi:MAG TPA: SUMF1/EgtB/PvdO family nonheme iron enzyme [Chitinophagaceae bacterium]|nr:SUMF1/EgtB/PvdO family nonheme iron enzyme [Chitinophagaceae bacterium]
MNKRHYILFILYLLTQQVSSQSTDTSFKAYEQSIPGSTFKFKLVPIKGGNFTMGSTEYEKGRDTDEGPQKNFTISPFWMGAFEVTHDEFDIFFKDANTSQNSNVDAITRPSPQYVDLSWDMGREGGFPVNSMQQRTAVMYCKWLYNKTGIFYRLPTEAEWEYACRAGSSTKYFFGDNEDDLEKYAWYNKNSNAAYQKTGQLKPNAFGLYDMLGNVSEWVMDQYDENYFTKMKDVVADPELKPTSRHPRLLKGGSYLDNVAELRCANRTKWLPEWNRRDPQIPKSKWWLTDAPFAGFRVVRPFKQPSADEIEKFFTLYLSN